jgi:hypothetical protein
MNEEFHHTLQRRKKYEVKHTEIVAGKRQQMAMNEEALGAGLKYDNEGHFKASSIEI